MFGSALKKQQFRHSHRFAMAGISFGMLFSLALATIAPDVANAVKSNTQKTFNVRTGPNDGNNTVTIMVESSGNIGTFNVSASIDGVTSQKTISTIATNFAYTAIQVPNVTSGANLKLTQSKVVNPDNGYWNSGSKGRPVWTCLDGNKRRLAITSSGTLVVKTDVVCTVLNTFTLKQTNVVPSDTPTPCNCRTNNAAMVKVLPETGSLKNQKPLRINRPVIGWLTVPALKMTKHRITYGVDKPNLDTGVVAAFRFAKPGDYGVFALAAHRLGGGGPFRNLDKVEVGDKIIVDTTKHSYTYEVISTQLVLPTNTSVLDGPTYQQRVVLITCTPIMVWNQRIVVTGILTDSK